MESQRGVLVHTAGFLIGSLGLLLSIVTSAVDAVLGPEALVALSRSLTPDSDTRRLLRVTSEPSLSSRRRPTTPVPSISVTLHKTGDSIISLPPAPAPPRSSTSTSGNHSDGPAPRRVRSTVSFAATPVQLRNPQWLALPPPSTSRRTARSKDGTSGKGGASAKRRKLQRSTSSPQLASFASAGSSLRSTSCAEAQHDQENVVTQPRASHDSALKKLKGKGSKPKLSVQTGDKEEWQNVYVQDNGSPDACAVPSSPTRTTSSSNSGPLQDTCGVKERPKLRKVKTLGDLLRRVPNAPGPVLPDPHMIECTTKKAFAFASSSSHLTPISTPPKSSQRHSNDTPSTKEPPSQRPTEPRFCLSIKSPKTRRRSLSQPRNATSSHDLPPNHPLTDTDTNVTITVTPRDKAPGPAPNHPGPTPRKRTQPYEAPYFWVPPDHEQWTRPAVQRRSEDVNRGRDSEAGRIPRAPGSRVGSP